MISFLVTSRKVLLLSHSAYFLIVFLTLFAFLMNTSVTQVYRSYGLIVLVANIIYVPCRSKYFQLVSDP